MMSCSLVCLYWANQCRDYLFRDMELVIRSLADFLVLESSYVMNGCTRLVRLRSLTSISRIEQTWESTAWCYRLYSSHLLDSLGSHRWRRPPFVLRGPVPAHLPHTAYRSPHWSLPRLMPSCYTPFFELTLCDIHFPSLSDLLALLRHFKHLPEIIFQNVTWSNEDVHFPVRSVGRRTANTQLLCWPTVSVRDCADNFHPCILVIGIFQNCPISYLSETESANFLALSRVMTGMSIDGIRVGECKKFDIGDLCKCDTHGRPLKCESCR